MAEPPAHPHAGHGAHGGRAAHAGHAAAPAALSADDAELAGQLATLSAAVERYRDFRDAEREGWRKFGGEEPLMGAHYSHRDGPDYVHGDAIDFARPNNLMYMTIDGEKQLTGVAFIVRLAEGEPVPEGFAGDDDVWHVHDMIAAIDAALEERPILNWLAQGWLDANYRDQGDERGRLAMVHVWVTEPNPDGMFANHHRVLPYLAAGLPRSHADGASVDAARGVQLAARKGCDETLDGKLWIADVRRDQERRLKRVCADAARLVKAALATPPDNLNAVAEAAWRSVAAAIDAELDDAQKARVAAMTEHGDHGDHGGR
jgi:hypothetical protein